MAEVGLEALAHTAREMGLAMLRPYRTRFSKHKFALRQRLGILCLMRCEDWTFREAAAQLAEHRELRQTSGLSCKLLFRTPSTNQRYTAEFAAREAQPIRRGVKCPHVGGFCSRPQVWSVYRGRNSGLRLKQEALLLLDQRLRT